MKTYKVWVVIEEHDEETDEYRDVTDLVSIGSFVDSDEAMNFVDELYVNAPYIEEVMEQ